MSGRGVTWIGLAGAFAGLLTFGSSAVADGNYDRQRANPSGGYVDQRRHQDYQWYLGEYPYPFGTVAEPTYSNGCRTGWWQGSWAGHPRPQWATYCRR